jgi:hypothetical protein
MRVAVATALTRGSRSLEEGILLTLYLLIRIYKYISLLRLPNPH